MYPFGSKSPPSWEIFVSSVTDALPLNRVESQTLSRDRKSLPTPRLLCRLLDQPMNLTISDSPQYSEQDRRALTWSFPHACEPGGQHVVNYLSTVQKHNPNIAASQ